MATLHDAETGAAEQQQHGGGGAGAARLRGHAALSQVCAMCPAIRATARPRLGRPLSGQFGASAISATGRDVLHHPLHELINVVPANIASPVQVTSRSCGAE